MDKKVCSIALCRVSTSEQAQTGHSLERQGQNVLNTAEALDAPIIKTWSLDQSSRAGKNFNRKDLNEMIDFCKTHKNVKYLIVDEVDRFMRDIRYFHYFEAVFEQLGVTVYYASQPELNSDNMMAKLQKLFLVFRAEASNDERINKSTNGLKDRVRLGYYPFPVPQGYKKTTIPGLFEPDSERFGLLECSFYEVLNGTIPAEALRHLTKKGYLTPQGHELQLNRFMCILKCPYYAGAIRIVGWDFTNDHALHKGMISLEEFERLQVILSGKKPKKPRKQHNPEFILSSHMECECGGKLVGYLHRNGLGGEWPKYRCRKCGKIHHRQEVHDGLSALLDSIELTPKRESRLKAALKQAWEEGEVDVLEQIKIYRVRKEQFKEEKKKYLQALVDNPDLKEDYRALINEMDAKIAALDREIDSTKAIDEDLMEFTKFALSFVNNQKENWWQLEYEEMIQCKQLVFPSGFSINYDKKVFTSQISPIFRFKGNEKEPFRGSEFDVVDQTLKFWNTFMDMVIEWHPILRKVYAEVEIRLNQSG